MGPSSPSMRRSMPPTDSTAPPWPVPLPCRTAAKGRSHVPLEYLEEVVHRACAPLWSLLLSRPRRRCLVPRQHRRPPHSSPVCAAPPPRCPNVALHLASAVVLAVASARPAPPPLGERERKWGRGNGGEKKPKGRFIYGTQLICLLGLVWTVLF